jgi:hypothetical protein
MNYRSLPLLAFVLILALRVSGQELPPEAVEVIKSFDARLADAEKLNLDAAELAIDTSAVRQEYRIDIPSTRLSYEPPRLRPLALRREQMPEQYRTFLKAGYGVPNSPFLQGGTYFRQNDQFDANLGFYHHSANFNKVENQRFGRTGVLLDGNYHIPDRFSVRGDIGFRQERVSYYGYDQADTTFTKEEARQRFNRFHMGMEAYNTHANNLDLDYHFRLGYYNLNDDFDARENGLDLQLALVKWFAQSHPLRLTVGNRFAGFRDTISKPLNNFYVQPSFTFHGEAFRFKAGLNLVSHDEAMKLLPDLELLVSLAGNAFAVYAGWRGDFHQNSLDNTSRYNPFMHTTFDNRTSIYRDLYGGVKGASRGWNYQVQMGLKQVRDMALFLPHEADTRRFAVLYDTVSNVYVSGGAGIELWPGLDFSGTLLYNFYNARNEDRAWHLPGLEANGQIRYKLLDDKLLLKGDLYIADGIPFRKEDADPGRLGALLDLSTSVHYQWLKNLGLWLQINNLTNNKRERWQRYPTFGTNVLGGVLMRF